MLQKRKTCVTIFEILVPVFFAVLLLAIRGISESKKISTNTYYDSFLLSANEIPTGKTRLLYTPSNSYTDALMTTVKAATNTTTCK